MAIFRLLTFGGLSLLRVHGAARCELRRSHLALLARLAASDARGARRDELLAMFWPESDESRARGSLKQAIYSIRRELSVPTVIVGTDELRLDPAVLASDVGDLEGALFAGDLVRAVELYRGPFLHAVHLGNGEFSYWRDAKAEQLEKRYREALVALARAAESRGDIGESVRWWHEAARSDPLGSSVASSLSQALIRSGDRTAALKHARGYAARVRADLETEPDADILAMIADLERAPVSHARPSPADGMASSSSGLLPETRPGRRAWSRFVYASLAVALVAVAPRSVTTARNDLLLLSAGRGALDSAMVVRLVARLQSQDSALDFTSSRLRRPRFVGSVRTVSLADSVQILVELSDRASSRSEVIGPVFAPRALVHGALDDLAQRVGVAIAARRNPVFESWAHAASMPLTWDAYHALDAGIRSWTTVRRTEPLAHFDTAASLDPTSAVPLVWKALVLSKVQRRSESDSVLRLIEPSGRRIGAWDRAVIDVLRAWNAGDLSSAHLAGHRLLEVVPRSEWAVLPAYDAMALGREREALELFKNVRADLGWTSWWVLTVQGQALHLVGEYATEARKAREAFARDPDVSLARQHLVRAYAALGRVRDVEQLCLESLQLAHSAEVPAQPCGQAMIELWAHGHHDAASRLADAFNRMLSAQPMSEQTRALNRIWALQSVGRWQDAAVVLSAMREPPAGDSEHLEYLQFLGYTQAWQGDRVGAMTTRARMAQHGPEDPMFVGGLHSLLGEKDEAVGWITRALRGGLRHRTMLHWHSPFASLHAYASFQALLDVRDDVEHRQRYAQSKR